MIKKLHIFSSLLLCALFFTSCKKEIVADDIYAYWKLQNDVEFTELAFTNLDFLDVTRSEHAWIDPVVNDSIYHYVSVSVKSDSLCLVDDNNQEFVYTIKELHDSVLVITDFPGADKDLVFKRINQTEEHKIYETKATDFPSDSLDINLKYQPDVWKEYGKLILTNEQVRQAHTILENYMNKKLYYTIKDIKIKTKTPNGTIKTEYSNSFKEDGIEPLPFNHYFRQYYGYMKDGHLIVNICLVHSVFTLDNPFLYSQLKYCEYLVDDGGIHYGDARIDLTEGKVTDFHLNGEA